MTMGAAGEERGSTPRAMRIETLAVGGPRSVSWHGQEVVTSIFKTPVPGPVMARGHNLDGDRQADLQVHGGEFKAVYAYAAEHYGYWRARLGRDLEPAHFGENLTISGLDEPALCIGDVVRIGEAELEATLPRLPCFKLGIRWGDPRMVKAFAQSRRWGIYFRISTEGRIALGDAVTIVHRDPARLPVYEIARVYTSGREDLDTMRRLAAHPRLDPSWRDWFLGALAGAKAP
jgi:MOSC domain-containing protein YiiM